MTELILIFTTNSNAEDKNSYYFFISSTSSYKLFLIVLREIITVFSRHVYVKKDILCVQCAGIVHVERGDKYT
jgi:hypothetical protein